jgi:hypothetical protein
MNSALQRAGVAQEIREALSGHTSKSINVRVYSDTPGLQHLKEGMEKLTYKVAIPPFTGRDEHEGARTRARLRERAD